VTHVEPLFVWVDQESYETPAALSSLRKRWEIVMMDRIKNGYKASATRFARVGCRLRLGSVWLILLSGFLVFASSVFGTPLGDLAHQLSPGSFAKLDTNGLNNDLLTNEDAGSYIFQWTDDIVWDPRTQQLLFIGVPHTGTSEFITYSAATNAWTAEPDPYFFTLFWHAYDHNAIDSAAGLFYHRHNEKVYRYDIVARRWSELPDLPASSFGCCGGFDYFPELKALVFVDGDWGVWLFNTVTNSWQHVANTSVPDVGAGLPNLPMGPYHNFTEYSPVHKVMIFGGGNGSSDLYRLDASGTIRKMRNAPVTLGIAKTIITVDPVSGHFLVFSENRSVYQYNPLSDAWTLLNIPTPPFFDSGPDGPVSGTVATPVSTHGVVLFVNYNHDNSSVYLYRHTAGGAPTVDLVRPAPPAGLSVSIQ
jgi:hypothetical protein